MGITGFAAGTMYPERIPLYSAHSIRTSRSRTSSIRAKSVLGNMVTLCPFRNNILEHQACASMVAMRTSREDIKQHLFGTQSYGSIILAKYTSLAHQKQKYRHTKEDYNYSLAGSQDPHSGSGMHMKITKARAQWE